MNFVIATYPDYDSHMFGIPWAAPCDSDGRPYFKAPNVGHFTGGHGKGGDLYVSDPTENSVWVCGRKNYRRGVVSGKFYVQFHDGEFHLIDDNELVSALNQVPTRKEMDALRKLIGQLQKYVESGEKSGIVLNQKEVKLLLDSLNVEV